MVAIALQMDEEQLTELRERFGRSFWGLNELSNEPLLVADELAGRFVQRCIGTVLELEEFQRGGGALLLESADGSIRDVRIKLSTDGDSLGRLQRQRRIGRRGVFRRTRDSK